MPDLRDKNNLTLGAVIVLILVEFVGPYMIDRNTSLESRVTALETRTASIGGLATTASVEKDMAAADALYRHQLDGLKEDLEETTKALRELKDEIKEMRAEARAPWTQ